MPPRRQLSRRYVGVPGSQVHLTEVRSDGDRSVPLYCLHATAYSGQTFEPFMLAFTPPRTVVAIDTPGYGASDPPHEPESISQYARRLLEVVAEDNAGRQVDLLGYHTGALMAAEMARQAPEVIRRLVLIGIPYFIGEERERWRSALAKRTTLEEGLSQFEERWKYFVGCRNEGVPLRRAFQNFVDELRAYPNGWWAHDAAFRFAVEACFPEVAQPTLVLNPNNHLSAASRQAALVMSDCVVEEMADLENSIFDLAPQRLATAVERFLSGSDP